MRGCGWGKNGDDNPFNAIIVRDMVMSKQIAGRKQISQIMLKRQVRNMKRRSSCLWQSMKLPKRWKVDAQII